MNSTRFFRNLWRINGVLILLSALTVILVLGFVATQLMNFGRHEPAQVVKIDQQMQEKAEPPTLGNFQMVTGTSFMRADLTFGDRYDRGSFSCKTGSYSTRNYLFWNVDTLEGRWLFPDNKQLIMNSEALQESIQSAVSGYAKISDCCLLLRNDRHRHQWGWTIDAR